MSENERVVNPPEVPSISEHQYQHHCAHCNSGIPEPVLANSAIIEKIPDEDLAKSASGSWNACMDIWYRLGYEGKYICRECFWK